MLGWAFAGLCGSVGAAEPKPAATSKPGKAPKPPFRYEPVQVRNGCFVESVIFYDRYQAKQLGGKEGGWCRVMSWGAQEGDYQVGKGHAVAVFSSKRRELWFYDINFGFRPLDVAYDRRADITDTAPPIVGHYPQQRAVFLRSYEDFPQRAPKKKPDFLFYHANPDVRDATKVAHALAGYRPVRVVEFDLKAEGGAPPVSTAATVFIFSARLCVYLPRAGTHISKQQVVVALDDLAYVTKVIEGVSPGAANVRWQPGGYWLMPPKKN